MGITASQCVELSWASNADAYLGDTYTVIRTSGTADEGWRISSEPHRCEAVRANYLWAPTSHAHLSDGVWRVFLINTKSGAEHSCGWRRVGTFWPSRLTGDQSAIDAWCAELKKELELQAKTIEPPAPEPHCCESYEAAEVRAE